MISTPGFNMTGKGFFALPLEIRNTIYEYTLADVEDEVSIRIDGGTNANHSELRLRALKRRVLPEDDEADIGPKLTLLLACKQINSEATSIAYSKMSMSLTKMMDYSPGTWRVRHDEASSFMANLRRVFGDDKLKFVKKLILKDDSWLSMLACFDCYLGVPTSPSSRGPIGSVLHHVDTIVLHSDREIRGYNYMVLPEGRSWVSVCLRPVHNKEVLTTFSSLRQIVVKKHEGGEQTSLVQDGIIYAAESGMETGAMIDMSEL